MLYSKLCHNNQRENPPQNGRKKECPQQNSLRRGTTTINHLILTKNLKSILRMRSPNGAAEERALAAENKR